MIALANTPAPLDGADCPVVHCSAVIERITQYLTTGGAFNPELADHVAVRDLLIDCRDVLVAIQKRAGKYSSPLVRQEGFAIVEMRGGVLMTHGFALTEWEADQQRKAMLETVSPYFYGPIHILPAVLNYSTLNTQATSKEGGQP